VAPPAVPATVPPASEVLEFWFGEPARSLWFTTRPAFDDEIRSRFGAVAAAAAAGELDPWAASSDGALALTITLDQFPRNIHRGTPAAFAHDGLARAVAGRAIERGFDLAVSLDRRMFFYLPFEHSEALADQERSVELFSRWVSEHPDERRAHAGDQMTYAVRHHEIIRRFGRFPHRNAILGRAPTPEEIEFLCEPRSSF
ncbi:MAG TPA: DUF924 family protein, partial [Kofleriaceae bacterium]